MRSPRAACLQAIDLGLHARQLGAQALALGDRVSALAAGVAAAGALSARVRDAARAGLAVKGRRRKKQHPEAGEPGADIAMPRIVQPTYHGDARVFWPDRLESPANLISFLRWFR